MNQKSRDETETVEAEPGVRLAQPVAGERMNAQHFAFEPEASASEHSHPSEQVPFLYEGELTVAVDEETHHLKAGDSLLITGDVPHAAENRGEACARGVDVFSPVREDTP